MSVLSPILVGNAICNVLGLKDRAVLHAAGNSFGFSLMEANEAPYLTLKVAITPGLLSEIDAEIQRLTAERQARP